MNAASFAAAEKLQAVERESRQRRHVYPRLVAAGKMTQRQADRQIAIMLAIEEDYRNLAQDEAAAGRLL